MVPVRNFYESLYFVGGLRGMGLGLGDLYNPPRTFLAPLSSTLRTLKNRPPKNLPCRLLEESA